MKRPSKPVALGLLTLAAALLALVLAQVGLLRTLELKTLDLRFRLLGDQEVASSDIVLIAIDDASIKTLEPLVGRWPWPRDVHAVLLQYLDRAGANQVIFDLLFTERDAQFPQGDIDFAETTAASGNVLHSIYLGNQDTGATDSELLFPNSIPFQGEFTTFADAQFPIPELSSTARALGHVTATLDADGPWRRYLLLAGHEGHLVPSLALSATLVSKNQQLSETEVANRQVHLANQSIPLDADWRLPIWYNGGPGTYEKYSYGKAFVSELQIREGQDPGLDPDLFKDKTVIVGISAAGLHDLFTTPYSGGAKDSGAGMGKMYGFEIHAHVLDDLLHGRFLRQSPGWLVVSAALAMALAAVWLTLFASLPIATIGLITLASAWLTKVYVAFTNQLQLPVVPVLLSWGIALALGFTYQYWVESAEKRRVKKIFSRYVSPDVYSELLENPSAADLGGTRRQMSVLFSDLRGFTTFSEGRTPEAVIEQLNEYFAAMVEVVFAHRGTVDKFVGDMIMALFGAPLEDPDHADHAVRCALAMQRRLQELNAVWRKQGRPELACGVGINSGEMVAGNLGSEKIQAYTVIGDNVNLGARIESLCKEYSAEILISESTHALLAGSHPTEALGEVVVKGKTEPVEIFKVPLAG